MIRFILLAYLTLVILPCAIFTIPITSKVHDQSSARWCYEENGSICANTGGTACIVSFFFFFFLNKYMICFNLIFLKCLLSIKVITMSISYLESQMTYCGGSLDCLGWQKIAESYNATAHCCYWDLCNQAQTGHVLTTIFIVTASVLSFLLF